MPRYFFNTRIGDDTIPDVEGEELRDADHAWVLDVYPAGEAPIEGVTARMLVERAHTQGQRHVRPKDGQETPARRIEGGWREHQQATHVVATRDQGNHGGRLVFHRPA